MLKKEETAADETKSEKKKKNVKGITYQVSSTYSFVSNDLQSNFSSNIYSQKSNEENYSKTQFSQKSDKFPLKGERLLWKTAEIGELKISLSADNQEASSEQRVEVDLLSNDVENILIEHAFKIQKLKDAW